MVYALANDSNTSSLRMLREGISLAHQQSIIMKATTPKITNYMIKVSKKKWSEDANAKMIKTLEEAYRSISYQTQKIPLSTNDGIWMVKISDIMRMEGEGNYTKIFFKNEETLLIAKTLKEYERILVDYKFERIHKSHLVNLHYIKKYYKNGGGYVLMEDGKEIAVSKFKRERLMIRLELL